MYTGKVSRYRVFHRERRKFLDTTNPIFIDDFEQTLPFPFPPSRFLIRPSLSGTDGNYHYHELTNNETPYTCMKYERSFITSHSSHTIPNLTQHSSHRNPPRILRNSSTRPNILPDRQRGKRISHSKPRPIVILSENSPGDKRRNAEERARTAKRRRILLEEEAREADFSVLGTKRSFRSPRFPVK